MVKFWQVVATCAKLAETLKRSWATFWPDIPRYCNFIGNFKVQVNLTVSEKNLQCKYCIPGLLTSLPRYVLNIIGWEKP